jgi:hypothetical protein
MTPVHTYFPSLSNLESTRISAWARRHCRPTHIIEAIRKPPLGPPVNTCQSLAVILHRWPVTLERWKQCKSLFLRGTSATPESTVANDDLRASLRNFSGFQRFPVWKHFNSAV